MNKKTFLIVFLIAFLHANCVQAFNLSEFSKRISLYSQSISSWFKEHNVGPLLAASFFSFLAYKVISSGQQKSCSKNLYSINVLHQEGSTCAYHALKNGLLCYEINIFNQWINDAEEPRFTQQNHWETLYQLCTNETIKIRRKRVLKNNLVRMFNDNIQNPTKGDPRLITAYKEVFGNLALGIAEQAVDFIMQPPESEDASAQNEYPVRYKQIFSAFQTNCFQSSSDSAQLDKKTLADDVNIKNYIPFLDTSGPGASDVFTTITREQIEDYPISRENLDGDEIKALLNVVTDNDSIRNVFTIVDDINQLEWLENFETARTQWNHEDNYFHIFLVGTMSERNRRDTGHWFLLAAQKINGDKRYFKADSLGDNQKYNQHVNKIIEKINSSSTD